MRPPATAISKPELPLAIVFVCQHDFTGPSEKQMLGFAQRLAAGGHRVMFSLGASAASVRTESLKLTPGIELHEHRFSGPRLRDVDHSTIAAFEPDVIHVVNSRVPTMTAASEYVRRTGAPLFVHFEDNEWAAWRGVPGESFYYRLGRHVRRLESVIRPQSWPHSTARTRRLVARKGFALDALTPELADEVSKRFRRPCETLLPVSPLVDKRLADEVELPDSVAELPLIVVTGTIYPFSIADTMQGLKAVAEVQRRGHAVGYIHPGNVHPRINPEVLAHECGLARGTFVFPGLLPYAAISPLLRRARVLLQPGAPSEFNRLRLPSKLQAYLESGTPTITFATGFGKLLQDREEVMKIHTDRVDELADCVVELLEDSALAASVANGGRRAAARLFDPDRNTAALVSHYRRCLARQSEEAPGSQKLGGSRFPEASRYRRS